MSFWTWAFERLCDFAECPYSNVLDDHRAKCETVLQSCNTDLQKITAAYDHLFDFKLIVVMALLTVIALGLLTVGGRINYRENTFTMKEAEGTAFQSIYEKLFQRIYALNDRLRRIQSHRLAFCLLIEDVTPVYNETLAAFAKCHEHFEERTPEVDLSNGDLAITYANDAELVDAYERSLKKLRRAMKKIDDEQIVVYLEEQRSFYKGWRLPQMVVTFLLNLNESSLRSKENTGYERYDSDDEIQSEVTTEHIDTVVEADNNNAAENTNNVSGDTDNVVGTTNNVFGNTDNVVGTTNIVIGSLDKVLGFLDRVLGFLDRVLGFLNKAIGFLDKVIGNIDKVAAIVDKVVENIDKVFDIIDSVPENTNSVACVNVSEKDVCGHSAEVVSFTVLPQTTTRTFTTVTVTETPFGAPMEEEEAKESVYGSEDDTQWETSDTEGEERNVGLLAPRRLGLCFDNDSVTEEEVVQESPEDSSEVSDEDSADSDATSEDSDSSDDASEDSDSSDEDSDDEDESIVREDAEDASDDSSEDSDSSDDDSAADRDVDPNMDYETIVLQNEVVDDLNVFDMQQVMDDSSDDFSHVDAEEDRTSPVQLPRCSGEDCHCKCSSSRRRTPYDWGAFFE